MALSSAYTFLQTDALFHLEKDIPITLIWVKGALKMGIDPLVGEYIRGLDALKEPLVFPKLVGGLFGMEE